MTLKLTMALVLAMPLWAGASQADDARDALAAATPAQAGADAPARHPGAPATSPVFHHAASAADTAPAGLARAGEAPGAAAAGPSPAMSSLQAWAFALAAVMGVGFMATRRHRA